jgi:hypothetical protein|tara:strand:+ start:140 stop:424 length:285 start_codon:yes stop_codon:yes gene_type:complete
MELDLFYVGIILLILSKGFVMARHYNSYMLKVYMFLKENYWWQFMVTHVSISVISIYCLIVGFDRDKHLELFGIVLLLMGAYYIPKMIREYKDL